MKKIISSFVMMMFVLMVGTAQAGPIDSLFGWLGYTPTDQYEAQVAATQAAKAEAEAFKASAIASQEAATKWAETAFSGFGIATILFGGLVFFYRRVPKENRSIFKKKEKRSESPATV